MQQDSSCPPILSVLRSIMPEEATGFEKVKGIECLYRYRPNGVYYGRFVVNGKEVRQSLKTTDRDFAKRELAHKQREQSTLDVAAGKITLATLIDRYLPTIAHQAKGTVKFKTAICARMKTDWSGDSGVAIRKVVPSMIQSFLSRLKCGPTGYNAYLSVFRAMFTLAKNDRLIAASPVDTLTELKRNKPIRRTPTWEEFQAIVADIRKQPFNADAKDSADFVEFIGLAGLGQAEASAVTVSDVEFGREQMTTFRHKTRTGFAVPIFPQLRLFLERMVSEAKEKKRTRLFVIKDAKKAIAGACRRLQLPAYTHRSFRRMFVTRALENGVDVKVVSEWQGHKDGGKLILDTYSHVSAGRSKQMAELMTR